MIRRQQARPAHVAAGQVSRGTGADPWVWTATVSLVIAIGLAIVSVSFVAARQEEPWTLAAFWLGMLLLFVPVGWRVMSLTAARSERIALLVLLGMALYAVKILHSPTGFTLYDELQHLRTLFDISDSQRLFTENPLLRTSPLYPGLEIATQAVMAVSGLPPFAAGLAVVGAARIVLVLAIFLLIERVADSSRIAGAGTLIYVANPSFLFFDAQFAYESFALPLGAMLLYVLARRAESPSTMRVRLTILGLLVLGSVIAGHHLTSYLLIAFLVAWTVVRWVMRSSDSMGPGGMALLGIVGATAWLIFIATFTVQYLAAPLGGALVSLFELIVGEQRGRTLFEGPAPTTIVAPTIERIIGFAAVGILLLALPLGLWRIWSAARHRSIALALAVSALGYPASLAFRFTSSGAEAASRAAASLFIAIGLTTAFALVAVWSERSAAWRRALVVSAAAVVFMGGIVVGWPPWGRLPGPYLVGADARSIEQEGHAAALWMRDRLGADQRVVADRINNLLLGSYGRQFSTWYQTVRVDFSPVYFTPEVGTFERDLLRQGNVEYLVADRRLSEAIPQTGVYIDAAEIREGRHEEPIPSEYLAKFDRTPGFSRIFDSGNIRIFDVTEAVDADT